MVISILKLLLFISTNEGLLCTRHSALVWSPSPSSFQSHEGLVAGSHTPCVRTEYTVVPSGREPCRRLGRWRPVGGRVDGDEQRNQGTK